MAQLIVALDLPDPKKALDLAATLASTVSYCKVGLELFTRTGPSLIRELKSLHYGVFLDLKFYDIPHTVARAVASVCELHIDMLTLHCQGGETMLKGAQKICTDLCAHGATAPLLFGVTVLTSFGPGELPGISAEIPSYAMQLAHLAHTCGLSGVVCSPKEVASIKSSYPDFQCICPGIRPSWAAHGDQKRLAEPAEAVRNGADWLVVGRPILEAKDPVEAAAKILSEMELAKRESV